MIPDWIKRFPRYKVIRKVITEVRGESAFKSWAWADGLNHWGSHWYEALGEMMRQSKNDEEAEAMIRRLFYLADNDDSELERVFISYRLDNPKPTKPMEEKKPQKKSSFLQRLFGG
jgi:hypothetical protein